MGEKGVSLQRAGLKIPGKFSSVGEVLAELCCGSAG